MCTILCHLFPLLPKLLQGHLNTEWASCYGQASIQLAVFTQWLHKPTRDVNIHNGEMIRKARFIQRSVLTHNHPVADQHTAFGFHCLVALSWKPTSFEHLEYCCIFIERAFIKLTFHLRLTFTLLFFFHYYYVFYYRHTFPFINLDHEYNCDLCLPGLF